MCAFLFSMKHALARFIQHKVLMLYPSLYGVKMTCDLVNDRVVLQLHYASVYQMYDKQKTFGDGDVIAKTVQELYQNADSYTLGFERQFNIVKAYGWNCYMVSMDIMIFELEPISGYPTKIGQLML